MKIKSVLLLAAVLLPLHSVLAAAAIENSGNPVGLRIANAQLLASDAGVTVDASIFRSRLITIVTPATLQISVMNADGSIAASETKVISAANAVRLNSRQSHVKAVFANVPNKVDYTVSVKWL